MDPQVIAKTKRLHVVITEADTDTVLANYITEIGIFAGVANNTNQVSIFHIGNMQELKMLHGIVTKNMDEHFRGMLQEGIRKQ